MMCIILLAQVLRKRIKREKTESALWLVSQDFVMPGLCYACMHVFEIFN